MRFFFSFFSSSFFTLPFSFHHFSYQSKPEEYMYIPYTRVHIFNVMDILSVIDTLFTKLYDRRCVFCVNPFSFRIHHARPHSSRAKCHNQHICFPMGHIVIYTIRRSSVLRLDIVWQIFVTTVDLMMHYIRVSFFFFFVFYVKKESISKCAKCYLNIWLNCEMEISTTLCHHIRCLD